VLVASPDDPRLSEAERAEMLAWHDQVVLIVPLLVADKPMGVVELGETRVGRSITAEQAATAASVCRLIALAVRDAEVNESLEELVDRLRSLSETDSLTGLANHRKIHEFLALEQARAQRYGGSFSLAMLDIDHFKLLNDTHGHPAGDDVLRQVAALLKEQTRSSDIVGRYGGDEFVLILPETTTAEAGALVEKLRAALVRSPYVTAAGERIPLYASKPGRLTAAEFGIVKTHPVLGETIIAAIPDLAEIRAAVLCHHERYDGKGYPHGLAGEEIPLLGRLLAVADCYSAMTTDRPYRVALSRDEALAEIRACSGSQFDPVMVEAFLRSMVSEVA
jgi:diguanylate cyclase (GGDEF)-like protein